MPLVEGVTLIALLVVATISYFIITEKGSPGTLLTPPMVAALLVANLVPAMALMVLVARRMAMRRAAESPIGGRGRLHVRLVALFSVIASVPTLLVVIFASLLFQSGFNFWLSDRAQTVIRNAQEVASQYRKDQREEVQLEVQTMGSDVVGWVNENGIDHPQFGDFLLSQTSQRKLLESALLTITPAGEIQMQGGVNLYDRPLEDRFTVSTLRKLKAGQAIGKEEDGDRVEAVVRLDPKAEVFVYGAREVNPRLLKLAEEAQNADSDYQQTLARARTLQFRFNAIMLLVSLLIVGLAIWIALKLADRLVRPVGELVDAARRITAGDLTTRVTAGEQSGRVPGMRVQDEIGILGRAFNRMTKRLEEQTGDLVSANSQLESRRAFIEAVLSGVTAGIISVDQERNVRLINSSAEALLKTERGQAVGRKLAELAPELDAHLDGDQREDIIQFASGGEPRTLAVKRVRVEGGHVLTFDDITEQLLDQRRAAWSDVARRIAHEIRNPLTPIQLAAERLQRRYGKEITSDAGTFEKLTGTIVRQVGDLRRMVDEFSSFARMPKPVFREERIADVVGESLFLHQVAHPDIAFRLDSPEPSPLLVCDRRQMGQALTNVIKNAVEAIQQKREDGRRAGDDRVSVAIRDSENRIVIEVADTGIGLPSERGRLTEPYMTTRVKGTGLGLAIVKKIVEEHFGNIEFDDSAGGGSLVRLVFDSEALSRLAGAAAEQPQDISANG
ncbi:MAG TPA: ATP-binding protein [Allosphingosinicella sp.]|jgi:two-component system nitrogen regulation sensor histidine kinase NtrY|nr:ATP-binding protein [Allosphingosinicella sp.]